LKEEKTISQLASELGIHPTQLKEWKKIALQGLPKLFSRESKASEQQVNELYSEIGRLATQVNCAQGTPEKNRVGVPPGPLSRSERLRWWNATKMNYPSASKLTIYLPTRDRKIVSVPNYSPERGDCV